MRDWIILYPRKATAAELIERACTDAVCSREEMLGACQARWLAWPRQDLMLALAENGMSYAAIGRLLGDRDHTTVIRGVRAAKARREARRLSPLLTGYAQQTRRVDDECIAPAKYRHNFGDASATEGSVA